jgi:hypothetical protein
MSHRDRSCGNCRFFTPGAGVQGFCANEGLRESFQRSTTRQQLYKIMHPCPEDRCSLHMPAIVSCEIDST